MTRLEQKNAAESWHQVYSGSNSAQRVTELAPGQLYSFRVSACNAVGCGPWSESGSVSTQLQPPYPPTSVSAQIQASSSDRHAPCQDHHLAGVLLLVTGLRIFEAGFIFDQLRLLPSLVPLIILMVEEASVQRFTFNHVMLQANCVSAMGASKPFSRHS